MHELPLVQSIITKASEHARLNGGRAVKSISLVVGDGTGYVPESIQMYFDIAATGTMCEGALLSVRRVKPLMRCEACGILFERKPFSFDCPDCGGEGSPTETGKELYIEDIEIFLEQGDKTDERNNPGAGDGSGVDGERPPGGENARGL
jgi:hydrogenase nickel incorporation protein HypA/HybF